MKYNMKTVIN